MTTKERRENLKVGYDFVYSLIAYEDPEYIIPFESVEQAAEHIGYYKHDFQEEFPACLEDPQTLYDVWNDCIAAEKSWREEREQETNTRQPDRKQGNPDDIILGNPELSFEISECGTDNIDLIIAKVNKDFPGWKFDRTESRYESCVMAIFKKPGD